MYFLAFNGSPNETGNTAELLEIFTQEAVKSGAEVETIQLYKEEIPFHSGKLEREFKPSSLQKKIMEAAGFVIATPTHWFNVSTPVKVFVDHLTDLEENGWLLVGKKLEVCGTSFRYLN